MEKGHSINIIIVENDDFETLQIRNGLESRGYVITDSVASGEEALISLQKNPADIVIMDIGLDGEMDGVETADKIYRKWQIPIVYLSGKEDLEEYRRIKNNSYTISEYVAKPFMFINVLDAIERVMDRLVLSQQVVGEKMFVKKRLNGYQPVMLKDILYLQADDSMTKIFTLRENEAIKSSKKLKDLEQVLSSFKQFKRCEKSHLVNLDNVHNILEEKDSGNRKKLKLALVNNHFVETIPVGKNYKQGIQQCLLIA